MYIILELKVVMNKILIICVDFFEFNVKKKRVGIKVINIGNL